MFNQLQVFLLNYGVSTTIHRSVEYKLKATKESNIENVMSCKEFSLNFGKSHIS